MDKFNYFRDKPQRRRGAEFRSLRLRASAVKFLLHLNYKFGYV